MSYLSMKWEVEMTVGFFGGKFIPFHKGHLFCVDFASKICDKVYVLLFDSNDNQHLKHGTKIDNLLTLESRIEQIKNAISKYQNVEFKFIDTAQCVKEDGTEDWDKETPLVIEAVGNDFKYVFTSEPSYDPYFKRAYPWATHIVVDEKRIHVPISGTKVRAMNMEEALKWLA